MTEAKITKLDLEKANYREWKTQVIGLLRGASCMDHVKPEMSANLRAAQTQAGTANQTATSSALILKENKAVSILLSTLGGVEGDCIDAESDTAAQIWEKLSKRHESFAASEVELRRQSLKNMKKTSTQTMAKYSIKFMEKVNDFTRVGGKMEQLELCRIFLSSLDDSWTQFQYAHNTSAQIFNSVSGSLSENKLTLDALINDAKEADNIRIARSGKVVKEESNLTTQSTTNQVDWKLYAKRADKWKKDVNCTNCGGVGHYWNCCSSFKRPNQEWKVKNATLEKAVKEKAKPSVKEEASNTLDPSNEAFITVSTDPTLTIILDNGCTTSLTPSKEHLSDFEEVKPYALGTISDSSSTANLENMSGRVVRGKGTLTIESLVDGKKQFLNIKNCNYVPGARRVLISEPQLRRQCGYNVQSTSEPFGYKIMDKNVTIAEFILSDENLYFLENGNIKSSKNESVYFYQSAKEVSSEIWHSRLCHPGHLRSLQMAKRGTPVTPNPSCDACLLSKMRALPHQPSKTTYKAGELVVGDYKKVKGADLDGEDVGFFVYVDVHSGYSFMSAVKGKEAPDQMKSFIKFKNLLKTQCNLEIKKFRHDRGKEFLNDEFQGYLIKCGIEDQSTARYSPESNGIAESHFRILDLIAKAQLTHANLNISFYKHALLNANYVFNRTVRSNGQLPFKLLFRREPNINHLRVFGCKTVFYIPKEKRELSSFPGRETAGRFGRFIGYADNTSSYLIWDGRSTVITRDVKFYETIFNVTYYDYDHDEEKDTDHAYLKLADETEHATQEEILNDPETSGATSSTANSNASQDINDLQSNLGAYWNAPAGRRRGARQDDVNLMIDSIYHVDMNKAPKNLKSLLQLSQVDQKPWRKAMESEIQSLEDRGTFEVIQRSDLTEHQQLLDTTWVFTTKEHQNETICKARLCIRGDKEQEMQSLEEIFSTVARTENIRLLLTIIATLNWEFAICDVKNAFVNATLKRAVFIKIPYGYPGNLDRDTQALKVSQALYGLRRSPNEWNNKLYEILKSLGFERTCADWNLFMKTTDSTTMYIAFHVDDGLITSNDQNALRKILEAMSKIVEIKTDYQPLSFLRVGIARNRKEKLIGLSIREYIETCARKFEVSRDKIYATPMDSGFVPTVEANDTPFDRNKDYRALIGSLMHISRMCRPDITFATNVLSKHLNAPQVKHWNAGKRVLSYLYQTRNDALILGNMKQPDDPDFYLRCYADATWADDSDNRRSRSGGIMFFNGSLISAWSKQQATVALSSTDAEYQSMALGMQEILYYRSLLTELGLGSAFPSTLLGDNKGALDLSVSTKNHPRVKHIDIKFHFIREQVKLESTVLSYVNTLDQIADIMTKPLPKAQFLKLKAMMHVQSWGGVVK